MNQKEMPPISAQKNWPHPKHIFRHTDLLAVGFGTTVAMWAFGYVARFPWVELSPAILFLGLFLIMLLGGYAAGRYTAYGWRGGLCASLLISVLNLLILGSLITGDQPNQIVPSALFWLPGSFLFFAMTGTLGGWFGSLQSPRSIQPNWCAILAYVAAIATFLLLIAGGLVTSFQEGLSVPDWPNSYGYNMFLYPLSRMTGGIYYEHSHRLLGALVGLTTMILCINYYLVESRGWLRRLTVIAFVLVILQGVLGGLRVTGHFTLSDSFDDTRPNIYLAILHGVAGQIFFALMVAISFFASTYWKRNPTVTFSPSASTERKLNIILFSLLLLQLVFGAILRHIEGGLLVHITLASIIFIFIMINSLRVWGLYPTQRLFQILGPTFITLAVLQIVLGFCALYAISTTEVESVPTKVDIVFTTLHQIVGAFLLAASLLMLLWSYRGIVPVMKKSGI